MFLEFGGFWERTESHFVEVHEGETIPLIKHTVLLCVLNMLHKLCESFSEFSLAHK